jgi:hypothetical protein
MRPAKHSFALRNDSKVHDTGGGLGRRPIRSSQKTSTKANIPKPMAFRWTNAANEYLQIAT